MHHGVAPGSGGDVVVGGEVLDTATCFDIAIGHLSAASGEVTALTSVDGPSKTTECFGGGDDGGGRDKPQDQDRLVAPIVDPDGHVIFAGQLSDGPSAVAHAVVARMR